MTSSKSKPKPLEGLRVLDLSTVVAGPFGSDLLASLGAEVIRVSPPRDGASTSPRDSAAQVTDAEGFTFALARNKKSVVLNLKDKADKERFMRLVEASDVVYDNFRPGVTERLGIDHESLKAVNPRIVTCSISGYGSEGSWARVGAYDVTVQALSGAMSITGDGAGMPCRWGVPIGDITGAFYAVIGILAAIEERARTGAGQHVEVSLLDGQLALNTYRVPQAFGAGMEFGAPEPRKGGAGTVPYGPFLCGDGKWIVIGVASNFWRLFCEVAGLDDLIADPRFDTLANRQANQAELESLIEARLLERDSDHWQEQLMAANVPVGKVNSIREAFEQAQAEARGMAVGLEGAGAEGVKAPGLPIKFMGEDDPAFAAPVHDGAENATLLDTPLAASVEPDGDPVDATIAGLATQSGPLAGLLLLELCGDEPSGTLGTQMLADLGATVIKIERPGKTDDLGVAPDKLTDLEITPGLAYYFGLNRNKRSICLDLKSDAGRETFLKFAAKADVVYDNYKTGVTKKLFIDPDSLRKVNPDIITCSVCGFGKTGPWAHLPAYDATIQALGGGMSITGTGAPGAMPVRWGNPIGGIGGAFYAVIGILSTLRRRRITGLPATLDIALLDAQLAMHCYRAPPALSGRVYPAMQRRGGSGALPYGPFLCSDGKWFALGITNQFWPACAKALGHPEWIDDPRFDAEAKRQDNEEDLNDLVSEAIAKETSDEWQRRFVDLGIPGAAVKSIPEAFDHPHVKSRDMLVSFDHPIGGRLKVAGSPVKLSGHPHEGFRHAPSLGEDTEQLLAQLAGLSRDEIADLRSSASVWWPAKGQSYARPSVV